jgi:phosphinothricin acetyltransferase
LTHKSTTTFPDPLIVRNATDGDAESIAQIYAHYVLHGLATFEESPPTRDEVCSRLAAASAVGLPFIAAERAGRLIGYAYASPYRTRPAYRFAVEDSVYIAHDCVRCGCGTALFGELIDRCERGPWRQMIAVIGDSANGASIALHRKAGFSQIGTFRGVGFKLGRWVDTVLMQRSMGEGEHTPPKPAGAKENR